MADRTGQHVHDAVVVGAGFGGLGAAIQLRRLGHDDIVVLEREDDLGGTWHVNRYPGLAVDIPSATYSYSFEPNPSWSRLFAPGRAQGVRRARRRQVRPAPAHPFRGHGDGARWDDDAAVGGRPRRRRDGPRPLPAHRDRLPVPAAHARHPRHRRLRGRHRAHRAVGRHSRWTGRRVGIIGTGATAVQLIPRLAEVDGELTVYQRTPIWVSPKLDGAVPAGVRKLFARVPLTQRAARLVGTRSSRC